MNSLEQIFNFLYRMARLVFGWKRRKKSSRPADVPDRDTRPAEYPLPGDESAGSDPVGHRRPDDPLPEESPHPPKTTVAQKAVNLTGWCLIFLAGLSKLILD